MHGALAFPSLAGPERLLAAVGLPIRDASVDAAAVLDAIRRDKKARDGRVPFVLAPAIGTFRLHYDVTAEDIRSVLDELRGSPG